MQRSTARLKTAYVGLVQKKVLPPTAAEVLQRKQSDRQRAILERQRAKDKEHIASIRTCLLRRFGEDISIQSEQPFEFRQQIMQLLDGRLYEAAATALKDYSSMSGRFRHFKRTFYRFARLLNGLYAEPDVLYIKHVLRESLDPELHKLQNKIAAFDRRITDPRTYESLLTQEIDRILKLDIRKLSHEVILSVESKLIKFADTAKRLRHDQGAKRVFVSCRLGSSARTECFLVLEPQDDGSAEILAIQNLKEFNRSKKKRLEPLSKCKKGDITQRGQRYANVPSSIRHLAPP